MTLPSTVRHRVVIVGSGFGGLFAAKSLAHAPDTIEVILISRTNHHLFQPLLYQVATGILSEGQIAPATRDVLKKKNVSIELAEVTGFDLEARHVTAVQPSGRSVNLSYDSLIVAAGAGQSYFGHDEFCGMGARNENACGRAQSPGPDIRGVRDGRAGGRPGDPSGVAHVRRRRRRSRQASRSLAKSRSCQGGHSNTNSGDSILPRYECSSSTVAQRSWLLSATTSPAKRRAN